MKVNIQSENSFLFWQKWLFYSSLLFAVFGLAIAFYSSNPLAEYYFKLLAHIFWNQSHFPEEALDFRKFVLGPLGGTIACCYFLMAYIARFPFKNKEPWARNAIAVATLFWFFTDSSISLYYGVYFQALVINLFSLIVKLLPLFFTWKMFRHKQV